MKRQSNFSKSVLEAKKSACQWSDFLDNFSVEGVPLIYSWLQARIKEKGCIR